MTDIQLPNPSISRPTEPLTDEELWCIYGIKSYPMFPDAAPFHVPDSWADTVRKMIDAILCEFGKSVTFEQIKSKFGELVVYTTIHEEGKYRDHIFKRLRQIEADAIRELIALGVYDNCRWKKT